MGTRLSCLSAVAVLVCSCGAAWGAAPQDGAIDVSPWQATKSLIRVDVTSEDVVVGLKQTLRSWDRAGSVDPGRSLDLVVTARDRVRLDRAGVPYEVVIEDIEKIQSRDRAMYHSFNEMETMLSTIATNYPAITQLTSLGQSAQGREIWCMEISDNPGVDEGEVGVVYMGLHHAREWPSLEICLEITDQLTSSYGSDPNLTDLVNNRRVWVVPCVNPDGYVYCHDQGHDWRKNRRYFPEFGTYGVDLNRNYAGCSNGVKDGSWGSIGSGSQTHSSNQETYCGPWAFSEPETQVIRDFCLANDFTILITYHTYSELVLWPWGYSLSAQTDDNALMASIGQGMASKITRQSGSGTYTPQQSAGLYPTTGDTTDWAYGYRYYELGKNSLAYTVEMAAQFQPPVGALQQVIDENWDGALYILEQAAYAESQMTPWVLPPILSTPPEDADGDYTVSWVQKNPDAGATLYELQELTGLSLITEDVESGSGLWSMQQFSLSTARSHGGAYSFKSPTGDGRIAAMTTIDPLPVGLGDTLSFWTWYDIETNWDMAFVEVSADGRYFEVLDKYTGSSGGWVQKSYGLDDYAGQSIYIRFRYTTDGYVTEEGFYVDDIYPIASWAGVTTLDNSIAGTSYPITGRAEGDYYYRVRGSNPEHGFGEYCGVQLTQVVGPSICPGDASCDGQVDFGDINPFVQAMLCVSEPDPLACWSAFFPNCPYENADVDESGTVDFGDINPFVGLLTTQSLPIICD